jgi:peptide/nickel transport system permease protein
MIGSSPARDRKAIGTVGPYILRRVLQSIPLLLGITLIAFLLIQASGDPMAVYNNNPMISEEAKAAIERRYGFDRPVYIQYFIWLGRIARGDFGYSFSTAEPVSTLIMQRMPNSLLLMAAAFTVTIMVATPLAIISALRQYSVFDHLATGFTFVAFALPTFWLGLLAIMLFSVYFRQWGLPSLPAGGMYNVAEGKTFLGVLRHLILPASILGLVLTASYLRYLRASLLEVLQQDYVRTARAKGLRERIVIGRHAVRNALIPVVTLAMMDIPFLFAGALVTEQVFAWPGMGRLFWEHAVKVDYPVLMAILVVVSMMVIFCNLLADILYAYLDPRIRFN